MTGRVWPGRGRCAAAFLGATVLVLLTGCASHREPDLYGWRNYEKNLDAYFRADRTSPDEQLQRMEDDRRLIEAEGKALPPGFQAHLGLLHGRKGDAQSLERYFQLEKQQFPEGAGFMDFLLRNFKKQ